MKRYYAYIRVSTAKQGERGSSLQEQRSAIEAYASRHALSIDEWFEERETAAKSGRAVFARMLAKLEKGVAQGLVVHKIDRSARNMGDWAKLGELIDKGLDVHFAHDAVDLRSRGGRLSADIQAVVAADYVRNLREEVLKGQRGRLKQGLYPWGAPIGYLDHGKAKAKTIDPLRGPLIREAFERYATGAVSIRQLRSELKSRGLALPRSGKPLSIAAVSHVLNNPFYSGIIHVRRTGESYQGKHEPLVSAALFERVQAILRGKLVVRSVKHDFTFRKFVKCASCRRNLIGERHKGRYVYYRCQNSSCRGTVVREELLDHLVQSTLSLLAWDEVERAATIDVANEMAVNAEVEIERLKSLHAMQIEQCNERLIRLTDAYLDATIDKEAFEHRKYALLIDLARLKDAAANLSADDLPSARALKRLELGNAAYSGYRLGNLLEQRHILSAVTSNCSVRQKEPVFELLSPFQEVANWRKSQVCPQARLTPENTARQLLELVIAVDEAAKKEAAAKKAGSNIKMAA